MTTEPSDRDKPMSSSDGALHAAGTPRTTGTRFDPRTRLLLEAPITGTLLRLAAPNVLVMIVQASVGLIETYFIGKLGTEALAGVALVFPVVMLMQMMSAGAMGGGISSAIARALGAGRRADADALVLHALAIAVAFGLGFMLAVLGGGRWLYSTLGGSGTSLAAALTYSNVVFAGALLVWIFNSLANVIRGTGNMLIPAIVTCTGAAVLIPVSPCLIFGWGPLPAAWGRRGCRGGARVLRRGERRPRRLSLVGAERRPPRLGWPRLPLAAVPRHSAGGRGCCARHRADQSHHRHRDRLRRTLRAGGDRGLRHGLADRVPPGSPGLRAGWSPRRHGGDQHRRGPA